MENGDKTEKMEDDSNTGSTVYEDLNIIGVGKFLN